MFGNIIQQIVEFIKDFFYGRESGIEGYIRDIMDEAGITEADQIQHP